MTKTKQFLLSIIILILILLSFYIAPKIYDLSVFIGVLHGTVDPSIQEIIIQYRGIRTLVAILAGATIATSGLILQTITRNDLASPGMMSMNAGGALFMSVAFSIGLITTNILLPVFAIIGAIATGIVVYSLSYQLQKYHGETILILVGAMMGTTLFGIVQLMMILDETTLLITLSWLFGSFNNRPWILVLYSSLAIVMIVPLLIYIRSHIAILTVSDSMAQSLGARTTLLRGISFLIAGVLSGISIAIAGPVAFIGLLVPHLTRIILREHDFQKLLIPNILVGVILALGSDIISRLVLHPSEVNIGIILSFMGGPFLLYILYRNRVSKNKNL